MEANVLQTLRYYTRVYLLIASQNIKARMQYRTDFIIGVIGGWVFSLPILLVFGVLFTTIPELAGWNFHEVLFIFSFYLLAGSMSAPFFFNIWQLSGEVRSGGFVMYYFRPLNILFYFMSGSFDLKPIGGLIQGTAGLIVASVALNLTWTLLQLLLLIGLLIGASLVLTSINLIAASTAFWVVNAYPFLSLALRMHEVGKYPLTIFSSFFRVVFTYVIPIGFIAFYPAQVFLRPGEIPVLTYFSPLVGIGTFVLAYWVWTKGVNRYSGTGT
jgi:ABC-2 type transport system permease protein